jgi:polyhydroxybutyrate depolymerase
VVASLAIASLLVASVLASCTSGSSSDPSEPSSTSSASAPEGSEEVEAAEVEPRPSPGCEGGGGDGAAGGAIETGAHVEVDLPTSSRGYLRYVPEVAADGPRPLVIDLHGYLSGSSIQVQLSAMDAVADREGFVLVTPEGTGFLTHWNAVPQPSLTDDIGFIRSVIAAVGDDLCIDEARTYVQGFSNGAFLASLLGCRLADQVAAIAAVAGLLLPEGCAPVVPVPVLAIHGTDDRFVSYEGSPNAALDTLEFDAVSRLAFTDLPFAPVERTAQSWAALDGCDPEPEERTTAPGIATTSYGGCAGGAEVVLHTVEGGGHTWPSSAFTELSASILGPTTTELDASAEIWAFFERHARTD